MTLEMKRKKPHRVEKDPNGSRDEREESWKRREKPKKPKKGRRG